MIEVVAAAESLFVLTERCLRHLELVGDSSDMEDDGWRMEDDEERCHRSSRFSSDSSLLTELLMAESREATVTLVFGWDFCDLLTAPRPFSASSGASFLTVLEPELAS